VFKLNNPDRMDVFVKNLFLITRFVFKRFIICSVSVIDIRVNVNKKKLKKILILGVS
jgi:hypothetical protein